MRLKPLGEQLKGLIWTLIKESEEPVGQCLHSTPWNQKSSKDGENVMIKYQQISTFL